jgi:hypothetical protein
MIHPNHRGFESACSSRARPTIVRTFSTGLDQRVRLLFSGGFAQHSLTHKCVLREFETPLARDLKFLASATRSGNSSNLPPFGRREV